MQEKTKIILGIMIFTVIIFFGCEATRTTEVPGNWKTIKDPHGFELSMPTGYTVDVSEDGVVSASKGSTEAVMETIILEEPQNGNEVLNYAIPLIKKAVGDIEIISVEKLPGYDDAYVARVRYGNKVGAILLVMEGTKGFIAGMFDDADRYNATINDLVKIINSFKYNNDLKEPEKVEAEEKGEITELKEWTDPVEGAFKIKIPEGWQVSSDSGITRPYIDASAKILLTKDDMGISIEQLRPPLYYTPNLVLTMSGITEGSSYANGIVKTYQKASEYLEKTAPAELGLSQPIQLKDRQDLVKDIYRAPWIKETTAAEASFKEEKEGKKMIHNVIVAVEYYELAGTGMWAVSMVHYWAPEDEIEKVAKITDDLMNSFELDKKWGEIEQQQVAARTGMINAAGDDIAKTIASTFEFRDEALDKASKQFSNAILGVEEVYDPVLGESYTVPNDAEYYWKYFDKIIGTENYENILNDPNLRPMYCPLC